MARVVTTVEAVRARFTALQQPLAFFDGPGGTQVPDSVIEAIGDYFRHSNANTDGPFGTSRRTDALLAQARATAADFLNATVDEVAFGANMTTLNFALTRTASRAWSEGDEIVCTKLDHDGNVSPWIELAHDRGFVVKFAEVDGECRLDVDHLRSLLSDRTRVVAFPWAANSVGTVTPVAEVAARRHPGQRYDQRRHGRQDLFRRGRQRGGRPRAVRSPGAAPRNNCRRFHRGVKRCIRWTGHPRPSTTYQYA